MTLRAVILDVYHTLLQIGPGPRDAAERWQDLLRKHPGLEDGPELKDFAERCSQCIKLEHQRAEAAGVACPEVFWPEIARSALPGLESLSASMLDEFLFDHAQLIRQVSLVPGAAESLRRFRQIGRRIGIASNAQPYTLRELGKCLEASGLSLEIFDARLQFWSFAHGFSKPNPHAFRFLEAQARALGILPNELLMIGDRLDNDIAPAQRAGWQTWQISASPGPKAGSWVQCLDALPQLLESAPQSSNLFNLPSS